MDMQFAPSFAPATDFQSKHAVMLTTSLKFVSVKVKTEWLIGPSFCYFVCLVFVLFCFVLFL